MTVWLQELGAACGRFAADEAGANSIEYALIAAVVSIAIAAIVFSIGTDVASLFSKVQQASSGGN